jgi:hypothetical protein
VAENKLNDTKLWPFGTNIYLDTFQTVSGSGFWNVLQPSRSTTLQRGGGLVAYIMPTPCLGKCIQPRSQNPSTS